MQSSKIKTYLQILFALSFWVWGTLFHLSFSNWLTIPIQFPEFSATPRDFIPWAYLLSTIIVAGMIIFQFRKHQHIYVSLFSWILVVSLIFLINRNLLTTPLENIHYIQYGLISWLLANALDPNKNFLPFAAIFLMTTFLGIVDEINQYTYLAKDYGNYLDFNDFFLNQLGAATGLSIHYGIRSHNNIKIKTNIRLNAIVCGIYTIAFLLVGMATLKGFIQLKAPQLIPVGGFTKIDEKLQFFLEREPELLGNWHQSFSGEEYYVLSSSEWIVLFFSFNVVFYWLARVMYRIK